MFHESKQNQMVGQRQRYAAHYRPLSQTKQETTPTQQSSSHVTMRHNKCITHDNTLMTHDNTYEDKVCEFDMLCPS